MPTKLHDRSIVFARISIIDKVLTVIAIPLAMGILAPIGFILPPVVDAAVMSWSTIIVAINAMTLRGLNLDVA